MENTLKGLTIQEKFKVIEAIKIYPHWCRDDINIDDDWRKRVLEVIDKKKLEEILKSQ